ncbi:MAG: 30S ribosomal protein S12 methylthiotransferase RimO [Synergistaceae bacterium]|nr:30S ribosomal protein S12 methylthiotransferase RimO [Synergistaceae bacterium]
MNIFVLSMGCAKNSVDSEHLIGRLIAGGHKIVDDAKDAQVGLINTCAFIQDAVKENVDAVLDLELLKEQGKLEKIIVAGCMVNRYEAELREELPTVDLWARSEEWDKITDFLAPSPYSPPSSPAGRRGLLPGNTPWSRYLKVSEGCDTLCSYCTIPMIRGRLRSVPVEQLAAEAKELCEGGARELCLVGQDLTAYGRDVYGEPALDVLLRALDSELPDETWIRLLYLHPDRITRKFLDFISGMDKILPYLDIPIQHIDETVLASMNRSPDAARIRDIFTYLRGKNPLFALRTTIMVGFPGETEERFRRILDFLEETELDRVGAFAYSAEEGTKAALLPNQVPDEVKQERLKRLMELQSRISSERNALFVGKTLRVLVEEIDRDDDTAWGRSFRDAPEVDGMVSLKGGGTLAPGSWADATVTDFAEHDLFAVLKK